LTEAIEATAAVAAALKIIRTNRPWATHWRPPLEFWQHQKKELNEE
jgi:hypothetical protein